MILESGDLWFGVPLTALSTPSVARVGTGFDVALNVTQTGGAGAFPSIFAFRNVTSGTPPFPEYVFGDGDPAQFLGYFNDVPLDISNTLVEPPPAIGTGGHVAQAVTLSANNVPPTSAILMKPQGPIGPPTLICFDGQEVVYGVPGDLIGQFAVPFSINGSGEVGFRSEITGGSAVLLADTQQVFDVVARTGEWALGNPNDLLDVLGDVTGGEHVVRFNSLGRSAFRSTTTGASEEGIWLDNGQARVSIAHGLTMAPGFPGQTFLTFQSPAVTALGEIVFRACIDQSCIQTGVWRATASTLSIIARSSGLAPDASGSTLANERFLSFSDPSIGLSGKSAFRAALDLPGAPQGIWRWSPPGDLRRVVRSGDALRGTSLTFSTFEEELAVADSGEIAFVATMSDGQRGLFLTSQVGTIVKVAKVGEAFSVNGTNKAISQIAFHPGSSAQGNGGFVQQLGPAAQVAAVAFTLTFTDLTQATVLTTLE